MQNISADPVTEKYKLLEKPLKSREIGLYQINEILKSDGSDGFYGRGKITDPADPVQEYKGFFGHCDRLCGTEKTMWGLLIAKEQKEGVRGFFGKS